VVANLQSCRCAKQGHKEDTQTGNYRELSRHEHRPSPLVTCHSSLLFYRLAVFQHTTRSARPARVDGVFTLVDMLNHPILIDDKLGIDYTRTPERRK